MFLKPHRSFGLEQVQPGQGRRARRQAPAWALAGLVALTTTAWSAPEAEPPPKDPEGYARAQRAADRVKLMIRQFAEMEAAKTQAAPDKAAASPKPAAKPAARSQATPAPLVTRRVVSAEAPAPASAPVPASPLAATSASVPSAVLAAEAAPLPPAVASATAQALAKPGTPPPGTENPWQGVQLFGFEDSSEGFGLNRGGTWEPVEAGELVLTNYAMEGRSALQVRTPEGAFLGMDFPEPMEWQDMHTLSFWVRSKVGFLGKLALKTGRRWDWCEYRAAPAETVRGYTLYRVQLNNKACPELDLEEVRGLHLWVQPRDMLFLDGIMLE